MNIVIIEDEPLAIDRLSILLKQYDSNINIVMQLHSVQEAIDWLTFNQHPDLLFLDIHLSDGYSFSIFEKIAYNKPIIFTTAYDQYALKAFEYNSIDYLLKPITSKALNNALDKYKNIYTQLPSTQQTIETLQQSLTRKRISAKAGAKTFFVDLPEIAYFIANDKLVHIVDKTGNKLLVNEKLDSYEKTLPQESFFRINRSQIANISHLQYIKPYVNNRLQLIMNVEKQQDEMIVSRERVASFKLWAEGSAAIW
jgi:DNA-binding LytR/AlgR family response regulator